MQSSGLRSSALVAAIVVTSTFAKPSPLKGDDDIHLRARMIMAPSQTCGLHSLYVCAKAGNRPFLSIRDLHKAVAPLDTRGTKASDLIRIGREHGLPVTGVQTDLETLRRWNLPSVLHVNGDHYIALLGQEKGRLVIFDNNFGLFDCSKEWFHEQFRWEGVALVVGDPPTVLADAVSQPRLLAVAALAAFAVSCICYFTWLWAQRRKSKSGVASPNPAMQSVAPL